MCGIFGVVSRKQISAARVTHQALCKIAYRGYDSWGYAFVRNFGITLVRSTGKIFDVPNETIEDTGAHVAIGHSRWATHGGVTEANAHPHLDVTRGVAVIHNGIIENHEELRAFLARELRKPALQIFASETDSEVVPQLISCFIERGASFESAFVRAINMLEGRYAIVAIHKESGMLLAARNGSPLLIGKGNGQNFVASDVLAFLEYTRTLAYLGDFEYARITADKTLAFDLKTGNPVELKWQESLWDAATASRGGYAHMMLKETMEQKETIAKAACQSEYALVELAAQLRGADRIFFLGCGTAAKMAKIGELYMMRKAHLLPITVPASEAAPYLDFASERSVAVAVSQSGETADVLVSLAKAQAAKAQIGAVLNVVGSSIDRVAEHTLLINAGPEIAVASTKAATAQIVTLYLLACAAGGVLAEGKTAFEAAYEKIATFITDDLSEHMRGVATALAKASDIYIIGRGLHWPIALEAAIKIQEVSYVHAEGFPGGELKHGPIALIEAGTPVIAFVPNDETRVVMESNIAELKARGAFVLGIGPQRLASFDEWVETPDLGDFSPLASLVPIQLLAYHLAVLRGNDPDAPRNLAKSVTVV